MATGYMQERYESIPGNEVNTPTLSTKMLYSPLITANARLNPNPTNRDDENRNLDEPLPVQPGSHAPTWETESRAYPDLIGFRLKELLGNPVTTVGNGVVTDPDSVAIPTGAFRHVWTAPFGPSGASPLTSTKVLAYKDQGVFFSAKGCAVEKIDIESPEEGGVRVKSSGPALFLARVADPALTPTYESLAIRPFTRGGLSLTWLTGSGTTEDFSLSVSNPVEVVRSLGVTSKFPDVMEKGEGLITFTGSIPKRQIDADDYDALLNSTGFAATAKWVSDTTIVASYTYKLWVSMSNCQYTDGTPDDLSNKRRLGASFDFKATNGGAASVTVTVVNATTSYA